MAQYIKLHSLPSAQMFGCSVDSSGAFSDDDGSASVLLAALVAVPLFVTGPLVVAAFAAALSAGAGLATALLARDARARGLATGAATLLSWSLGQSSNGNGLSSRL